MNRDILLAVVQGQAERNILPISITGYLSKMKVMTELLSVHEDIRTAALITDEAGNLIYHEGLLLLLVYFS